MDKKNIKSDGFSDKYSLLPEEIKIFLSSELSGEIVLGLASEYKIKEDVVYSFAFLAVNSDFDLKVLKDALKGADLSGITMKRFWLDLLGRMFLPLSFYVEELTKGRVNIEEEFKKEGGKIDNYSEWIDKFNYLITEENAKVIDELLERFEKEINPKEEEDYITDLLSGELLDILRIKNIDAAAGLNSGFIYLLFNSKTFKDQANKIILSNKELIGRKNIFVDERELAPSVSNWLKDFIKVNGSDLFSDIVLAQYLNNSDNAKKLEPKDKELLSGVLSLYKNITFFPESMSNLAPEDWQIFPFNKKISRTVRELGLPQEKKIEDVLEEEVEEVEVEEATIAQEPEIESKIDLETEKKLVNISVLRKALEKYHPTSLEYKAIEEEIRRLER